MIFVGFVFNDIKKRLLYKYLFVAVYFELYWSIYTRILWKSARSDPYICFKDSSFFYDDGSITTLMTEIYSNDVSLKAKITYKQWWDALISTINIRLMKVFEQKCIIDLALEKTQDKEKRE